MIRRKHNRSAKLHVPLSIQYRGKPDSAEIECSCGYVDLVATWYTGAEMERTSGVRTEAEWDNLLRAVEHFLGAAWSIRIRP